MSAGSGCACCGGLHALTPVPIFNRPGLDRIGCRVGTYAEFKRSLLARLSAPEHAALRGLTTRADDDFAVALLDAWATTADVLTFYNERVAHESYLRTATERRSLVDLARLIGYRPHPGLAAHTFLAFTVEDAPGALGRVSIPAGFRVQSVPTPGQLPQTFETGEAIEARREWNAIRPLRAEAQRYSVESKELRVAGTNTLLKAGDSVLISVGSQQARRVVREISVDPTSDRTLVTLEPFVYTAATSVSASIPAFSGTPRSEVPGWALGELLSMADLLAMADTMRIAVETLVEDIRFTREPEPPPLVEDGVFALRVKAALFGHNAPLREDAEWPHDAVPDGALDLDRVYDGILKDTWIVLRQGTATVRAGRIEAVDETSVARYGLSGRVTRLRIAWQGDAPPLDTMERVRETVVHAQAERLTLAEVPIETPVSGNRIELDGFYELQPGRTLILEGVLDGTLDRGHRERVVTREVLLNAGGRTEIVLETGLGERYRLDTVVLNGNVVPATHGETVGEALGSGDGGQAHQRFRLRQSPLTHTGADTPSGVESSLEVRVDGVRWHEVPHLYGHGAGESVFSTWTGDDGTTEVRFGGAGAGARAATGTENVVAAYRKGLGTAGLVAADQLTLIPVRPRGVRAVRNPLAARDAQDPESMEAIRSNASLAVLTLDRLVSLRDHEDFARAFGGVAKALATWSWDGERRAIFVTVAGTDGAVVPFDAPEDLGSRVLRAMQRFGVPYLPLRAASHRPALFRLDAELDLQADHAAEDVISAAHSALAAAFGFAVRGLGQALALSEVVAVLHGVAGVQAVDVDALYRLPADGSRPVPTREETLVADAPAAGQRGGPAAGAELLTIDVHGISLRSRA